MVKVPYSEYIKNDSLIRFFDSAVSEEDLVWHKDEKPRVVELLLGEGWKLQMDNQLPFQMRHNEFYFIPKLTHHRLIKGNDDLILKITEIEED